MRSRRRDATVTDGWDFAPTVESGHPATIAADEAARADADFLAVLVSDTGLAETPTGTPTRDMVRALVERVELLEARILHQFGALAAYASLDERRAEEVRDEAHHHAMRVEATVIGLLEQLHGDVVDTRRRCDDLVMAVARLIDHQRLVAERIARVLGGRVAVAPAGPGSPTVVDRDIAATDERLCGAAPAEP